MPLDSSIAVAERLNPRQLSYKDIREIWGFYNKKISVNIKITPTDFELFDALKAVDDLCDWHFNNHYSYLDYDRDLYQACSKQCHIYVNSLCNHIDQPNESQLSIYLEERDNLNTLREFASKPNKNNHNTWSRLLLVLGSISAITYGCAYPALALQSLSQAFVFSALFYINFLLGIFFLPFISGLTVLSAAILTCLGVGLFMNIQHPSPQSSQELEKAMSELVTICEKKLPESPFENQRAVPTAIAERIPNIVSSFTIL